MMSNFREKIVSYQKNIYPGYSDTCINSSIYSDLYHLAVADFNQHLSIYNKCKSRLDDVINDFGILEEKSSSIGAGHSSKYVSLHMTSIYYHFLDKQNKQLDENLDAMIGNSIEEFCEKLCFDNAWSVSNEIMALGTILYRIDNNSGSNNLLNLSD